MVMFVLLLFLDFLELIKLVPLLASVWLDAKSRDYGIRIRRTGVSYSHYGQNDGS